MEKIQNITLQILAILTILLCLDLLIMMSYYFLVGKDIIFLVDIMMGIVFIMIIDVLVIAINQYIYDFIKKN